MSDEVTDKKRTILVVEDDELLSQAIVRKLIITNYVPYAAKTQGEALDYLESMDQPIDAIWLDYYLGMDKYLGESTGLDLLQKIKANEKWKNIPVVVVSNSASDDKIKSMLLLGANKYVLKAQNKLGDIIKTFDEFIVEENKSK